MKEALKMSKQRIGEHEVDVKKATPKMGNRGGGFGSPGGDFYGGYMDYYGGHTYQDYYGWGGYGGSVFLWDPAREVGFAYIPTYLAWWDTRSLESVVSA